MKAHTYYRFVIVTLIFIMGCLQPANPPDLKMTENHQSPTPGVSSNFNIPNPCQNLKFVGKLTVGEFRKLFTCLNHKGGLDSLAAIILNDPTDTELFVDLYNETFGADSEIRLETIALLDALIESKGTKDLFKLLTFFISEFIDTPDFRQNFKQLLSAVLKDDIDLLSLLKKIVSYEKAGNIVEIFIKAVDEGELSQLLLGFSTYLKHIDLQGKTGAQNLPHTLRQLASLDTSHKPTLWEDLYILNYDDMPRHILKKFKDLQTNGHIDKLVALLSDLTHSKTSSFLSQQRKNALKNAPETLTPEQIAASKKVLDQHPSNDLVAIVKWVSSLHRGFMEDTDSEQHRNLLFSSDAFLQGVKSAFDANPNLGPDAQASRVITEFCLFLNIAYQELTFKAFHQLAQKEKVSRYISGDASDPDPEKPYTHLYPQFVTDYANQHVRLYLSKAKKDLEDERDPENPQEPRWTDREIRKKLRSLERKFKKDTLPGIMAAYESYLQDKITSVFSLINTPLFSDEDFDESTDVTLYDLLATLPDVESFAVEAQIYLQTLKAKGLNAFLKKQNAFRKLAKRFFDFYRPVDTFLRSEDVDHSGSSWLSHTVNPLIQGFGTALPMKDQITFIASVESMQVVERLIFKDNFISDMTHILVPFLNILSHEDVEYRAMNLLYNFHTGAFVDNIQNEQTQIITQLSPLIGQTLDSGFLKSTFTFMAFLGKSPDTLNPLLKFLFKSENKVTLISMFDQAKEQEASDNLSDKIEEAIEMTANAKDLDLLLSLLNQLNIDAQDKAALIDYAQTKLLSTDAKRPIGPLVNTLFSLATNHEQALASLLTHTATFLSKETVDHLSDFIKKYDRATKHRSNRESLLTQMLKKGQMKQLLKIVERLLDGNDFQKTSQFFKRLIQSKDTKDAELEKALILLIKLVKISEG